MLFLGVAALIGADRADFSEFIIATNACVISSDTVFLAILMFLRVTTSSLVMRRLLVPLTQQLDDLVAKVFIIYLPNPFYFARWGFSAKPLMQMRIS